MSPPATNIWPLDNNADMKLKRGVTSEAVGDHCPVAGSKISAVDRERNVRSSPPRTSTDPFCSKVAEWFQRVVPIGVTDAQLPFVPPSGSKIAAALVIPDKVMPPATSKTDQ